MTPDWGGFRGIVDEALALEASDATRVIVDCPTCGAILAKNATGERSCPMGHYRVYSPSEATSPPVASG